MTILTTDNVRNLVDLRRWLAAIGPLDDDTPIVLKVEGITDGHGNTDVFSATCIKARLISAPAAGGHRIILAGENAL